MCKFFALFFLLGKEVVWITNKNVINRIVGTKTILNIDFLYFTNNIKLLIIGG